MRVTTAKPISAPALDSTKATPTSKLSDIDSFVARQPLERRVVHEILQNTQVAVERLGFLTDSTYLVTKDAFAGELSDGVGAIKDILRSLQRRYNDGGLPSKQELFELKQLIWAVEVEIRDLHLVAVASTIRDDTDYNFWDLFEAKDKHTYFSKRILNALSDDTCATLETLGVLARDGKNYCITDHGIQTLKEAIDLLSEIE